MSERLEISGFSLKKLRALSGSHDKEALRVLTLTARDRFADAPMNARLQSVIKRSIERGFPFPDLAEETDVHTTAASLLADYGQKHLGMDSNFWRASALRDLAQQPPHQQATELLKYLSSGRPLFGKHIYTGEQTYGYLSLAEIQRLRTFLREPAPYHLNPAVSDRASGYVEIEEFNDFPRALATWLKALDDQKQDLWIFQT